MVLLSCFTWYGALVFGISLASQNLNVLYTFPSIKIREKERASMRLPLVDVCKSHHKSIASAARL